MSKLAIDTDGFSAEELEKILNKGQLEVCSRNAESRFSAFTKCAISMVSEEDDGNIIDAVCAVSRLFSTGAELWIQHKNEQRSQMELQNVRNQLRQMERERDYNNKRIDEVLNEMPLIFHSLDSLKRESSVIYQLSVANLSATLSGNETIAKKLDYLSGQIESIDKKINRTLKHDYVKDIKTPSNDVIRMYCEITFSLKQGKKVSEEKFFETIRNCCGLLESIYDLRNDIGFDNAVGLIYGLLPAYTDLIIQYYISYFDAENPLHDAHKSWMKIFNLLESKEFKDDLQYYLVTVDKMNNRAVNGMMDFIFLKTKKYQRRINCTITDLQNCGSSSAYVQAVELSKLKGKQKIQEYKQRLGEKIGEGKAENIVVAVENEMANKDFFDEPVTYQKLDYSKLYEQQMSLGQSNAAIDNSSVEKKQVKAVQSIQSDKEY